MKTILIPIDFQMSSAKAIDFAKALYPTENLRVELLHVLPVYSEGEERQARQQYSTLQNTSLRNWPVHISFNVKTGTIIDKIQEAIGESKPQLVLIGLTGKTMVKELLKLTDAPLLIIPAHTNTTSIQKIVYANDFKEIQSSEALEPLRTLAQNSKSTVDILHIEKEYKPATDKAEETLEYYLQLVRHDYVIIKSDDFPAAILDYARQHEIDLLTLLLRDHGQNENNSKGKLVARLLEETNIPILSLV
jgi:hypothetical protein